MLGWLRWQSLLMQRMSAPSASMPSSGAAVRPLPPQHLRLPLARRPAARRSACVGGKREAEPLQVVVRQVWQGGKIDVVLVRAPKKPYVHQRAEVKRGRFNADTPGARAKRQYRSASFRWQRMLESASLTELAAAEKIERSYLCRVLRLTLLAPKLVEAILEGRQPEEVTLPVLMRPFPVEWERQRFRRAT